eukprot:14594-Heterococcus_DN1.PRE.3
MQSNVLKEETASCYMHHFDIRALAVGAAYNQLLPRYYLVVTATIITPRECNTITKSSKRFT